MSLVNKSPATFTDIHSHFDAIPSGYLPLNGTIFRYRYSPNHSVDSDFNLGWRVPSLWCFGYVGPTPEDGRTTGGNIVRGMTL